MPKTFYTLKEARKELTRRERTEIILPGAISVYRFSKKLFPRHKKRYFVGSYLEWINI